MEKPGLLRKPKVFYGYWIVMATFFCLFITSGCGYFAFSLFVKPLQAALGWGRGGIMVAWTIYTLVGGITSPFVGRLITRYEVRKIITIGVLIFGLGFVSLSLLQNLWHFYLSYAVIGVGMASMSHVPTSTIVSNWFKKRRGTAIGIMSTGVGAGGFVLAPIIGGYFIPIFGWRTSYLILAVIAWVVIIPLALLVIKTKPADMGLYPDGAEAPEAGALTKASPLAAKEKGLTLKMALATPAFWLIAVCFPAASFGVGGTIQSQAPHLSDIGFPVVMAAGALGSVGLGSLVGKFGFGWLCDRMPAKYARAIGLGLQLVAIAILLNIKPTSPLAIVWLEAIVLGLAAGSWLPTMSMLVSTNFGLAAYSTIYGVVAFCQSVGGATGPLVAGYMYDTLGTYHWTFVIFLTLAVVALLAILAVRRPKSLESLEEG